MAQYTSISGVKVLIMVLAFGFFTYILGPPLYWHFIGDEIGRACPPCVTECPDEAGTKALLAGCPKIDADMEDELQKTKYQKLQDEMKVQKQVAEEAQAKSDAALLEAKKTSSQVQKEFEKCNSGMGTSEAAREKAEELLSAQKKKTLLWEERAKQLGWKDEEEADAATDGNEEERRETEETETEPKREVKNIPTSKNGPKVMADLQQNLAVARFLYDRALKNEMTGVQEARQHASELNLL